MLNGKNFCAFCAFRGSTWCFEPRKAQKAQNSLDRAMPTLKHKIAQIKIQESLVHAIYCLNTLNFRYL